MLMLDYSRATMPLSVETGHVRLILVVAVGYRGRRSESWGLL